MSEWFMLTLVGKDQIGIVATVTTALYQAGCNLGEASMLQLGGNFTIMLMVRHPGSASELLDLLQPVANTLQLHVHVYPIETPLQPHQNPEVRISVYGADRPGIVSQVTTALAQAGLNIVGLESDIGGTSHRPFYILHIEGLATQGLDQVQTALQALMTQVADLEIQLEPIDTTVM